MPIVLVEKPGAEPQELADGAALWVKPRAEIKPEEYTDFYRSLAGQFDEPALTVHLRAEGRHEYTALAFVPGSKPFDLFDPDRHGRIKLYVRRVFITDDAEILPRYLRFVRGLVDSADLPLNVSREMIQESPLLGAIKKGVTSRVLSDLDKLAQNDPAAYAKVWEPFGPVLKEGLYDDLERRGTLLGLARFKTTASGGGWRSLKDYAGALRENQTAICRVGGGRAFALPPSARSNGSCGFPASRFPVWSSPLTGDDDPPASAGALRVSSMPAQGLSLCELVRTSAMYLPARRSSTLPHSTGPSPSGRSFGSDRRRRSSGSDPGPFALTPFLSTLPRSNSWHRFGRNFACAYIRPYPRGLQAGLCVACFSPFRLRVSHYSSHTFPMDDTRPPWVTDALPHRVARTHLGATGWNPCAFAPIARARPFPVFGRPVHRSGSLPLITTRWFSSSLSDPASRRAPCPPEHRRWWLQVGLSVSRLSPSCLTSLSIPSIHSGR